MIHTPFLDLSAQEKKFDELRKTKLAEVAKECETKLADAKKQAKKMVRKIFNEVQYS